MGEGTVKSPLPGDAPTAQSWQAKGMLIVVALIVIALATLIVAWGYEIDAEVAGHMEDRNRPVRRAA
jgi:hypothetical protein